VYDSRNSKAAKAQQWAVDPLMMMMMLILAITGFKIYLKMYELKLLWLCPNLYI
jgi:hypothetical protein